MQKGEIAKCRELKKHESKQKELLGKLSKQFGENYVSGVFNMKLLISQLKNSESEQDQQLASEYYGLVADNIETDEDLFISYSSVLGKRLFSHLVKNRQTIVNLMNMFKTFQLKGTFHFIPIEEVHCSVRPPLKVSFHFFNHILNEFNLVLTFFASK